MGLLGGGGVGRGTVDDYLFIRIISGIFLAQN